MPEELNEYKDPDFNGDGPSKRPPRDIVAYNELWSCADLANRAKKDKIKLPPYFQRDVVWKPADQTRFVDSLVKQLPIPSMCFAFDHTEDKWIVIDGLQRVNAIVNFLQNDDWRLSQLNDIDQRLSGKNVASFKTGTGSAKKIFDRVQNNTLPITVLRCRFSNRTHMEYLFTVFHRLNAGGLKLNNQEIRNCIFSGPFNDLLHELDKRPNWRKFNHMADGENYRFVMQEIVLRIFAFADELDKYTGHVGKFLNEYMHKRRNLDFKKIEQKRELFERTAVVVDRMFPEGTEDRYPTAIIEALFVGVMNNIDAVERMDERELRTRFSQLEDAEAFSDEMLAEGLSKKQKVFSRLNAASGVFSS